MLPLLSRSNNCIIKGKGVFVFPGVRKLSVGVVGFVEEEFAFEEEVVGVVDEFEDDADEDVAERVCVILTVAKYEAFVV